MLLFFAQQNEQVVRENRESHQKFDLLHIKRLGGNWLLLLSPGVFVFYKFY